MITVIPSLTFPLRFLDFLGFEAHIRNMRKARNLPAAETETFLALWRKEPAYFELALSKRQIYVQDQPVSIPSFVEKPDYEFEIGCLLNKNAVLNMSEQEAEKFFKECCDLTILNDLSARDFQEKDRILGMSVSRSKGILGKAIGPVFLPAKNMDIYNLKLTLKINHEIRSQTTYSTCFWTFPKIIHSLSHQNILLEAGTLLGSGTIGGGSIAEHGGKYPWLKNEDLIEMEADGIGILRNTILRPDP